MGAWKEIRFHQVPADQVIHSSKPAVGVGDIHLLRGMNLPKCEDRRRFMGGLTGAKQSRYDDGGKDDQQGNDGEAEISHYQSCKRHAFTAQPSGTLANL